MVVSVNDYLGNKYFIFSQNNASSASESDILVNNGNVFVNILCYLKDCEKENDYLILCIYLVLSHATED